LIQHPLTPPSPLTHRAALSPAGARAQQRRPHSRPHRAERRWAVGISSFHHVKQRSFCFPPRVSAPGLFRLFPTRPEPRGGRSAGRRTVFVVARVRRDARPSGRARLAALHRGGLRPEPRLPSPALPPDPESARPRRQSCLVGGVPNLPSRGSRRGRGTPHPAPPSGSSLEDAPR
jgi:hypothetical protein